MSLLGDGNLVEVAPQANAIPDPSLGPVLLQAVAQDPPPYFFGSTRPPRAEGCREKVFEVVTTAAGARSGGPSNHLGHHRLRSGLRSNINLWRPLEWSTLNQPQTRRRPDGSHRHGILKHQGRHPNSK